MTGETFDLERWTSERNVHGWLGKTPQEIVDGPRSVALEWKRLSEKARAVARMGLSQEKIKRAKEVEALRAALIQKARSRG